MWYALKTLCKHAWAELFAEWHNDQSRMLGSAQALQLSEEIRQSERSHSAEICVCFETALPISYLWRHTWRGEALSAVVQQRAMTLFGRYRVWDTAQNNGLLLYILGAERRMVVLADRGFNGKVTQAQWQEITDALSAAFKTHEYNRGLSKAMKSLHALCQQHYSHEAGQSSGITANEVGDTVIRL